MLKELIKLADHLDKKGLEKEASFVDQIIEKNMSKTANPAATLARALKDINDPSIQTDLPKESGHGFTEEDRQKLDTIHSLLNQIMTQL
tara:strand:+ start:2520 stop:2786 length:267 start_codon:yes stop_codon:yes gene_type:complete